VAGPVQVAVMIDRRSDVGTLGFAPDLMRLGDIPFAASFDRQRGMPSTDGVDHAIMSDHARTNVAMHAIRAPQFLAGLGIDSDNPVLNADNQLLRFLRRGHNDRSVPRRTYSRRAPDFLAGGFIERDERTAFNAGVDDQVVLVSYRRSARTPAVDILANHRMPK